MDNEKFRKSVQRYIGEPNNLTIEGTATPNSTIYYMFVGTLNETMSVTTDSDGKFVIPIEQYKYTRGFKFISPTNIKSVTKLPIGLGIDYSNFLNGDLADDLYVSLDEFKFGYINSNDINITNASAMFQMVNFKGSNDLDLISSVNNADNMFLKTKGDISGAFNIKYTGGMQNCFMACVELTDVQFKNTLTPTITNGLFNRCINLKSVNFVYKDENGNILNYVDFSKCSNISDMFTTSIGTFANNLKIGSMPGLGACKDAKQMTLDLTQVCTSDTELSFDCSEFADCSEFCNSGSLLEPVAPTEYNRTLALHKNQYNLFKDTDEYNKLLAKGWTVTST